MGNSFGVSSRAIVELNVQHSSVSTRRRNRPPRLLDVHRQHFPRVQSSKTPNVQPQHTREALNIMQPSSLRPFFESHSRQPSLLNVDVQLLGPRTGSAYHRFSRTSGIELVLKSRNSRSRSVLELLETMPVHLQRWYPTSRETAEQFRCSP